MSSKEIANEAKVSDEMKIEANTNLFSEINSGPNSEDHKKRYSLKDLSLNDVLGDDFEIFDKKKKDDFLSISRITRYKSVQFKSCDLNYLISQTTKNSNGEIKLNIELESIKEISNDKNKGNHNYNNENMNLTIDESNIIDEELKKRQLNNIKKVIKSSGNSINKSSNPNNQNSEKGNKNDRSSFNIESEIEKKVEFKKNND